MDEADEPSAEPEIPTRSRLLKNAVDSRSQPGILNWPGDSRRVGRTLEPADDPPIIPQADEDPPEVLQFRVILAESADNPPIRQRSARIRPHSEILAGFANSRLLTLIAT